MHLTKSEKSRENHKCIFCAKTFTQARSLNEHIDAIHDTKKNYECNTCGILFSQNMSLIQRQSHEDLCLKKHLKAGLNLPDTKAGPAILHCTNV